MVVREDIDAVFLDAGNTLVSIDFDRLSRTLASRSIEPDTLRRAEASARPDVSRWLASRASTEAGDVFALYLAAVFSRVDALADEADALAASVAGVMQPPGNLWRWVLPGVRDGLDRLHALGLRLAVVSNSDGTVEEVLEDCGLTDHLVTVVDSTKLGVEKPDPRIFEPALRACEVEPHRALYVGDLYDLDVLGARAAGLHAVLLDPFDDWAEVDCPRVRDLPDLAAHLESSR